MLPDILNPTGEELTTQTLVKPSTAGISLIQSLAERISLCTLENQYKSGKLCSNREYIFYGFTYLIARGEKKTKLQYCMHRTTVAKLIMLNTYVTLRDVRN